jgi:hypothetical protein
VLSYSCRWSRPYDNASFVLYYHIGFARDGIIMVIVTHEIGLRP